MPVIPYRDLVPQLAEDCFVAPGSHVIGDVHIGPKSSVWFGTVVRGDVFHIRVGAGSNLQDNSVVHVTTGRHATIIGDNVTVGHRVILHGCTVEDGALIGMGAVIMDRAKIGAGALIAAGSIVTEGTEIPPGTLALGSPARVKRDLTDDEKQYMAWSAPHYSDLAAQYASQLGFKS